MHLQKCVNAMPSALDSKRPRAVTSPEVEMALYLWVKHMEEKKETVNVAMLMAKREQFEKAMEIPDEKRLRSDGWVPKFCKA